ncbi:S-methylmethionine--homocysteine S-methyltransferase BHMT2 [Ictidomys tridecemlineatus]|uniref:Betaine--homocysteine S-methyltransferase 2 n=1 Tax=Ictidomys tridecemlineatus TaxID=43179 RepID=I3M6U1_ICTTR|nr:S-methylmethionine--homocysteine S-methyltransferase BHMT2 [Ictidomys tridecemlineatus]KAG3266451.1 S-methylmethionine--homocysteine S-methyltransferase BHMT2 [Ictidomys tridecemlineatus]
MAPAGVPGAKKGILERLDDGEVVIGDGSFLITLEKRGYVKVGLWTPEAVVEHPDAVRQLHMEFLRAGSNVMQTFTFSASEDNMESKWEAVNAAACDLAREVADKGDALVAGGICQTSVYKQHKDEGRIKKLFRQQLEVFARKNVDFLIAEYFEHVEEAVWAVEVLKELGKPVAVTMCIGPEGDMHDVTPGECAVKLGKAGANIIGVNCRFGPWTSLQTIKLMKEGLGAEGLKAHLMIQSLGFHTPDCGKGGFVDLPEYPFALEPRVATRWDIQKYAREAYNLGVRYIGGCCGFEPYHIRAIAEELAPERGFLPPASEKHDSWGSGLNMHTKPWIRARARREYWENLLPASGRPFCPSLSKPDI